jgi:hypothetical protein
LVLADSPPHHIERWRQGAEGEKATAKALQRLVADGWLLVNDIDIGRGNLDHVLIGPPGVFLLDSKKLHGVLSVSAGVLSIRWREDHADGYENRRLAPRMRNDETTRSVDVEGPVQGVAAPDETDPPRRIAARRPSRGRPSVTCSGDVKIAYGCGGRASIEHAQVR